MGDLTELFEAVRSGDQRALGEVFAITYDEVRSLARQSAAQGESRNDHCEGNEGGSSFG